MRKTNARRRLEGYTLYHYPGCPFCTRVRFALWWMGAEIEMRDIDADSRHERELISGGGRRQVPCLRIEEPDGGERWLYESRDIVAHLRAVAAR